MFQEHDRNIPIEEKQGHVLGENRNNIWASGIEARRFARGQMTTSLDEKLAIAEAERQAIRFQRHKRLMDVIDQKVEPRI
ncbi:MAG: hypothetical protein AAB675_02045 [Patescibacteria group bacterium]